MAHNYNNPFPELDQEAWNEDIFSRASDQNVKASVKAVQLLVMSLANLRSNVSSKIGYLNNKVERLHASIDRLDNTIKESVEKLSKDMEGASKSSANLASALNRLTLYGVLIASVGVFVSFLQFLYKR